MEKSLVMFWTLVRSINRQNLIFWFLSIWLQFGFDWKVTSFRPYNLRTYIPGILETKSSLVFYKEHKRKLKASTLIMMIQHIPFPSVVNIKENKAIFTKLREMLYVHVTSYEALYQKALIELFMSTLFTPSTSCRSEKKWKQHDSSSFTAIRLFVVVYFP